MGSDRNRDAYVRALEDAAMKLERRNVLLVAENAVLKNEKGRLLAENSTLRAQLREAQDLVVYGAELADECRVDEAPGPAVVDEWALERKDVLDRFTDELAKATGDGSKKRKSGEKPPWYHDASHEAAIFSHLRKWKAGELVDPDSGAHPLVHAAWRCLAIALIETGNVPEKAQGPIQWMEAEVPGTFDRPRNLPAFPTSGTWT